MIKQISKEELKSRIKSFTKKYKSAKKNINRLKDLGLELNIPVVHQIRQANDIDCKPKCTYCCSLRVDAFIFEVIAIFKYATSTMSNDKLTDLKKKIDNQYSKIKNLSKREHEMTVVECPLLFDGMCSVYKVRPLSCASFHSKSVENCEFSDSNPTVENDMRAIIPRHEEIDMERMNQLFVASNALASNNESPVVVELISALKEVFDDPSQVLKWQQGENIFPNTYQQPLKW